MTRTRPTGKTSSLLAVMTASMMGEAERKRISGLIAMESGEFDPEHSDLPSVHLRYGLKVMRDRGWSNETWGDITGDGPICILESVRAAFDCPTALDLESPEQYYIRKAFVDLGLPSPDYVSVWNDEQDSFSTVEMVMETAIFAAIADEERGVKPYEHRLQYDLVREFGLDPKLTTT